MFHVKHPAAANAEKGYRDKRARTAWDGERSLQNADAIQNWGTDAVGESGVSARSGGNKFCGAGVQRVGMESPEITAISNLPHKSGGKERK